MRWLSKIWWRLIRFGFRLLYYELAFVYDTVSWVVSAGQWRCWQRAVFDFLPSPNNTRILEIAHGTGNLQDDFYQRGYVAWGLDLSPYMGLISLRKLRRKGVPTNLIRGYAQSLPFPDESFDHVVITFPTNFISDKQVLNQIRRVLKADGSLLVVLSGVFAINTPFYALLELLYRITGQRSTDNEAAYQAFLDHLRSNRLDGEIREVVCERSVAIVFVAKKSFFS